MAARAGVVVHATTLEPGDRDAGLRIPTTSGLRTAWDVARWLPLLESVPVIDTLLAQRVVDIESLRAYLASHVGLRGSSRAAVAFDLADAGAQSPPESRVRVRLRRAGLPKAVAQLPVRVARGLVLHPDLVWEEYKVTLEYDGLWHDDRDQFHRDRRRLNLLVAEGWLVLHVTNQRLRDDFPGLVREIKAALRSRGWRP